ncbi:hypothetical protein D3C81_1970130 [compost metagenome]
MSAVALVVSAATEIPKMKRVIRINESDVRKNPEIPEIPYKSNAATKTLFRLQRSITNPVTGPNSPAESAGIVIVMRTRKSPFGIFTK